MNNSVLVMYAGSSHVVCEGPKLGCSCPVCAEWAAIMRFKLSDIYADSAVLMLL